MTLHAFCQHICKMYILQLVFIGKGVDVLMLFKWCMNAIYTFAFFRVIRILLVFRLCFHVAIKYNIRIQKKSVPWLYILRNAVTSLGEKKAI